MTTPAMVFLDGRTDVISEEPVTCHVCQRVAWWFRNEEGRSRCIRCVMEGERDDAA